MLIISHHTDSYITFYGTNFEPFLFANRPSVISCRRRAIFVPTLFAPKRSQFRFGDEIIGENPPPSRLSSKNLNAHGVRRLSPLPYLLLTYLDIDK
jgi:hypothetical protein